MSFEQQQSYESQQTRTNAQEASYQPRPVNDQTYTPHQLNNDPREQPNFIVNRQQKQQGGEKLRPQYLRRRSRGLWSLLGVVLLLLLIGAGLLTLGQSRMVSSDLATRTFAVSGQDALVVDGGAGNVHVHQGQSNQIVVQGRKQGRGFFTNLNDLQVKYTQDGNTVTVSVPRSEAFLDSKWVDLDIAVPTTTDLTVRSGSGDMKIEDVSGKTAIQTGSGDIQLQNVTGEATLSSGSGDMNIVQTHFNGQSSIKTSSGDVSFDGTFDEAGTYDIESGSGDIKGSNLAGLVTLRTNSGDVELHRVSLRGSSSLRTGSGDIHFDGSLSADGGYTMETGSGSVEATLPASSTVRVSTTTGSGSVHNDFANVREGNSSSPTLSIRTGSGNITVRKE